MRRRKEEKDSSPSATPSSKSSSSSSLPLWLTFFAVASNIAIIAFLFLSGGNEHLVINTESGSLEGFREDGVIKFLGIPYAKPPVGNLRWKPSEPVSKWNGVRAAQKYGRACSQLDASFILHDFTAPDTSEDCLFLNIWAPNFTQPHNDTESLNLPVLFWIHGGGWNMGSAGHEQETLLPFDGSVLASRGNHIVISTNYRLGVLGFLSLKELKNEGNHGTGNYGHLDMILALKWVKTNIIKFGGDPNRVTIFGESAGGMSVTHLLGSPLAKDLFAKAISQSGPTRWILPLDDAYTQGERIIARSSCAKATDRLSCLRALPTKDLQQLVTFDCNPFLPAIDGFFLTDSTHALVAKKQLPNAVPLIIGATRDEGSSLMFIFPNETTYDGHVKQAAKVTFKIPETEIETLKKLYSISEYKKIEENPYFWSVADMHSDWWRCDSRKFAHDYSRNYPNVPVYLYEFRFIPVTPKTWILPYPLRSTHYHDVPYLWFRRTNFTESEIDFSNKFIDHFAAFSSTGNPNPKDSPLRWTSYNRNSDTHIIFDSKLSIGKGLGQVERCGFWEKFYETYQPDPRCTPP